jgi:pimeloyl-ACP methyl ester carboxylesterase/predicted glycosyltransferase
MRAREPDVEGEVERDGVRLRYEVHGEGERTLLFVPPWQIVNSRVYKAQVPWFADRFRCVAYDPRGTGRSDRPAQAGAYGLGELVADALAVLDATGTRQAVLVGLSMGGMVSSVLAAHHPDRVAAAVLIGTVGTVGPGNPAMTPRHFDARHDRMDGWARYSRESWLTDYPTFARFFLEQIHCEPHSTKQIEDGVGWAGETDGPTLVRTFEGRSAPPPFDAGEAMYRRIACPLLLIHGDADRISPVERSRAIAALTGAELVVMPGAGHAPNGRYPARVNGLIDDFLARRLGWPRALAPTAADEGYGALAPTARAVADGALAPTAPPDADGALAPPAAVVPGARTATPSAREAPRILYLSSPIGLGHGRRDLAIAHALRALRPGARIDWLAQDPVTRLLAAHGESIHPLSAKLANESRHFASEADEHDLNAFQALRRMDEILVANFMRFQQAVDETRYDLVIADEAWDVDHHWHEHPELKRAGLAWFTDFVGYVAMPAGGEREAALAADYNAEMIEHVEGRPGVRDRAIFVGNRGDVAPGRFGPGLPEMPDWVARHFDFCGYVLGEHPAAFGPREALRAAFGWRADERVCVVTVGGSGVGGALLRRVLEAAPIARAREPALRFVVVAGPRIDPAALHAPDGVEVHAFVPDLDRRLAACDVAVVQGGLTTCMELAAAGTPFLYFPLRNHFEQNVHVAHRLDRYRAGRRMDFDRSDAAAIAGALVEALHRPAAFAPVEADGARRAAAMLAELI